MNKVPSRALGQMVLIVLLSSVTLAQQGEVKPALPSPAAAATSLTAGLVEPLGLTEEQVPRVEEVVAEMIERQRKALGEYAAAGEQTDQESMRSLQEALGQSQQRAHDALSDVLTEEQLAGFDEELLRLRTEAAGQAMVMRLREPLSLTDEQVELLEPIFAQHIRARNELMQKTRAQGRTFGAVRTQRAKFQQQQSDLEDQLRPILTDDQMQSYLEIAEQTRARMRERSGGRRQR